MIKKFLVVLASCLTPLTTFSCTSLFSEEYYKNQIQEMYDEIFPKYNDFTRVAVFAPKEWLEEDQKTIKEQYRQKGIDTFNITFFSIYPPYLEDIKQQKWRAADFARITTKEDFDTYIIERFKELNKSQEYNDSSKIKKLFEELYLNNQDAYEVLKTNDIYIKMQSNNIKTPRGGFIIPIYNNNQVTINTIFSYAVPNFNYNEPDQYRPDPSWIWEVFLIKKNYNVQFHAITNESGETAKDFRDKVLRWFIQEFAKHYL